MKFFRRRCIWLSHKVLQASFILTLFADSANPYMGWNRLLVPGMKGLQVSYLAWDSRLLLLILLYLFNISLMVALCWWYSSHRQSFISSYISHWCLNSVIWYDYKDNLDAIINTNRCKVLWDMFFRRQICNILAQYRRHRPDWAAWDIRSLARPTTSFWVLPLSLPGRRSWRIS
jgi:hypothetical protein